MDEFVNKRVIITLNCSAIIFKYILSFNGVIIFFLFSKNQGDGRNCLTMSVNTHEKILLMGVSKDLGWCKGRFVFFFFFKYLEKLDMV